VLDSITFSPTFHSPHILRGLVVAYSFLYAGVVIINALAATPFRLGVLNGGAARDGGIQMLMMECWVNIYGELR